MPVSCKSTKCTGGDGAGLLRDRVPSNDGLGGVEFQEDMGCKYARYTRSQVPLFTATLALTLSLTLTLIQILVSSLSRVSRHLCHPAYRHAIVHPQTCRPVPPSAV